MEPLINLFSSHCRTWTNFKIFKSVKGAANVYQERFYLARHRDFGCRLERVHRLDQNRSASNQPSRQHIGGLNRRPHGGTSLEGGQLALAQRGRHLLLPLRLPSQRNRLPSGKRLNPKIMFHFLEHLSLQFQKKKDLWLHRFYAIVFNLHLYQQSFFNVFSFVLQC
jgi:hypothetical protein